MELIIASNPDPDSTLPYLVRVPISGGLVFRTKDTWPRTNALYCHPIPTTEWPDAPEVIERIPLRACSRRGAAIDLVAERGREKRSQMVFTRARGRDVVFWQSPRTRKQARPDVRLPTARAANLAELEIVVDAHERYAYRFAGQQVRTVTRALPCGDYAVTFDGNLVASVERKSLSDLASSLTSGRLRFALAELAALPRAAVVVEDRYSQVFSLERVRPAVVADGLAELQVRWPSVPIVFCENRKLAEEWIYRYLAAAQLWAETEGLARARMGIHDEHDTSAPPGPEPSAAEVRTWARSTGLAVTDRGRLRPEIHQAWRDAHSPQTATPLDQRRDG
jgi:ERCC4-type nuclease